MQRQDILNDFNLREIFKDLLNNEVQGYNWPIRRKIKVGQKEKEIMNNKN